MVFVRWGGGAPTKQTTPQQRPRKPEQSFGTSRRPWDLAAAGGAQRSRRPPCPARDTTPPQTHADPRRRTPTHAPAPHGDADPRALAACRLQREHAHQEQRHWRGQGRRSDLLGGGSPHDCFGVHQQQNHRGEEHGGAGRADDVADRPASRVVGRGARQCVRGGQGSRGVGRMLSPRRAPTRPPSPARLAAAQVPVKTAEAIGKVLKRNCDNPAVKFEILSNPEFLAEVGRGWAGGGGGACRGPPKRVHLLLAVEGA